MTIPVYTAAKPSGITPQTTASESQTSSTAPSTTTTAPTSSYPPARPGAAAPTPTAASQKYAPINPTPTATTKLETDSPAPPQPGAIPTLGTSAIPPPPKAGEHYQPAQTTTPLAQPYPPQMSIPPPTNTNTYGQPPHSTTATTTAPLSSYPVPVAEAAPRRSLEHPPGYQQNVYASEMTSDQRRAHEAANYPSTPGKNNDSSSGVIGGIDTESVWNSAKKFVAAAGEKISEAEAEVWRRVNKE